jgi:hypothetical protein
MPSTFFLVKISINKNKNISFGPYLSIKEATDILIEFGPHYARGCVDNGKYTYSAKIDECILNEESSWEVIRTPIQENECYKRKLTA